MKNVILLLTLALGLSACDANVTDFVRGGGEPAREELSPEGPKTASEELTLGVSSGAVFSKSTDMSLRARVSRTHQVMTSTDHSIGLEASISAQRSKLE